MKTTVLPLAAMVLITQVMAKNANVPPPEVKFKEISVTPVNMSAEELDAYARDPANKPSLDFKPPGKLEKQPKNAGSFLKTAGQIIGGSLAKLEQIPWQVYTMADTVWLCGGSIISTKAVLTAAHCIFGRAKFWVTAGGIDRDTLEPTEWSKFASAAVYHPGYNNTTEENDIAILKFSTSWTFSRFIKPIRLPKTSQATDTFVARVLIASGYGLTLPGPNGTTSMKLKYAQVTVIPNIQCASFWGKVIKSTNICVSPNFGMTTCGGDSGGGVTLVENDGFATVLGIVSFGTKTCLTGPSVYTRVTSYLGWISKETSIIIG